MASSFVTVMLIPAAAFQPGQAADGRALAYLAHELLGTSFGTVYDVATILILWFAGSSAVAGLLTLVPRYLPRFGMAPEWARANRPLVVIITGIAIVISIVFSASVEAQGGAYATGVLVLMSSGALAIADRHLALEARLDSVPAHRRGVRLHDRHQHDRAARGDQDRVDFHRRRSWSPRWCRARCVRLSFACTDSSSTTWRSRTSTAVASRGRAIRIIANRPGTGLPSEYEDKMREASDSHHVPPDDPVLFLEIQPGDASEFSDVLQDRRASRWAATCILRSRSPAIPNAIAALLIYIRDQTGEIPHVLLRAGPRATRSPTC